MHTPAHESIPMPIVDNFYVRFIVHVYYKRFALLNYQQNISVVFYPLNVRTSTANISYIFIR